MAAKTHAPSVFDPTDHRQVEREVRTLLSEWYDKPMVATVVRNLRYVRRLYRGAFRGFRACNTQYHDLRHVHSIVLAAVRLLDGCNLAWSAPLPPRDALQLCLAAVYHDVGFIQQVWDKEGTGAKYTLVHVRRSQEFVRSQSARLGIGADLADGVCSLIGAADWETDWSQIRFQSLPERQAVCILRTADIAGQMADRLYLEKLLFLFYELREAAFVQLATAFDILRGNQEFYEAAKERLEKELDGIDGYFQVHFKVRAGIDANLYREAIERQMRYLATVIENPHGNFRQKLRRVDLNKKELSYYL